MAGSKGAPWMHRSISAPEAKATSTTGGQHQKNGNVSAKDYEVFYEACNYFITSH